MKNKLFIIVSVILCNLYSQNATAQLLEWAKYYDGLSDDRTLNVVKSGGNEFCITGTTAFPGGMRLIMRCYNSHGNLKSSKVSDIILPGPVLKIIQDDKPETYVVCDVSGDTTLIKFNPSLKFKWSVIAPGTVANVRFALNGDVVIGGVEPGGLYAAKYKHGNGDLRFHYVHTTGYVAGDVVVDDADNIYVGGAVPDNDDDMNIIKLKGNGTLLWSVIYALSPLSGGRDRVDKMAVDPAQNLYVFGELEGYGLTTANISASKFNSAGVHQWDRHVATAGGCCVAWAKNILFDLSWNPIYVGVKVDFYNVGPNETSRVFVNKLDRFTGAVIYFTHPDDIPYSDPDIYEDLDCAVTGGATGDLYLGGTYNVGGLLADRRWFVTRVDQVTGLRKWSEGGYDFSSNDNAVNSIVLDHTAFYIGLTEFGGSNLDMALEKYTQPAFPGKLRADVSGQLNLSGKTIYQLYPNPFNSSVKLDLSSLQTKSKVVIRVYDLSGRIIGKEETSDSSVNLGSDWEEGIYIIDVISENDHQSFRVIKQE